MFGPSPELRNYVEILRKIERELAEVIADFSRYSLNALRRNRGKAILNIAVRN